MGNAKALSGLILESDKIEAFYKENDSSNMNITEVRANVVVQDKKMKITGGDYAEYKILKDYFFINGKNIIFTSEKNILKSNKKLEY